MHVMQQRNLLWKGAGSYSTLENCKVNYTGEGMVIVSGVAGMVNGIAFKAGYTLHTNTNWQVTFMEVNFVLNGEPRLMQYQSQNGLLTCTTGGYLPQCACTAVDISVTPFTNTPAIKQLNLAVGQRAEITVLYVDVMENAVTQQKQFYTRLSNTVYRLETADGSFTADITVDSDGFVADYPGLFERMYAG